MIPRIDLFVFDFFDVENISTLLDELSFLFFCHAVDVLKSAIILVFFRRALQAYVLRRLIIHLTKFHFKFF